MRIIGGERRGHKIGFTSNVRLRPTSARVREALFSALEARGKVAGARALDVFAGVGSLGFEALSRGAVEVVFIDRSATAVGHLKANAQKLGYVERSSILKEEAARGLRALIGAGEKFDLIFIDPPYNADDEMLDKVFESGRQCLAEDGIVAVEHSSKRDVSIPGLSRTMQKRYGDTSLSFFMLLR